MEVAPVWVEPQHRLLTRCLFPDLRRVSLYNARRCDFKNLGGWFFHYTSASTFLKAVSTAKRSAWRSAFTRPTKVGLTTAGGEASSETTAGTSTSGFEAAT